MAKNGKKGKVINITGESLILPRFINDFEKLIVLPDYSPSDGLPVGCVAIFDKNKHVIKHNYLGQDVGCGMLVAKINITHNSLEPCIDTIAHALLARKDNGLGTLGHGNHFITIYRIDGCNEDAKKLLEQNDYIALIHSGSRDEGKRFYDSALLADEYFDCQEKVLDYARRNRQLLLELIADICKADVAVISNNSHNFIEQTGSKIIYRKGNVKAMPGDCSIIPSSMAGEAAIVTASSSIAEIEYAIPHATGRVIPRSNAKTQQFYREGYPKNIYVPYVPRFLTPKHLNEELPQNYRALDDVLSKISRYVNVEARLYPLASIML